MLSQGFELGLPAWQANMLSLYYRAFTSKLLKPFESDHKRLDQNDPLGLRRSKYTYPLELVGESGGSG